FFLVLLFQTISVSISPPLFLFIPCFLFHATPTTEIYTLSLHDALPIWPLSFGRSTILTKCGFFSIAAPRWMILPSSPLPASRGPDRKSTRLNSSHGSISYAVFCLKKKKTLQD